MPDSSPDFDDAFWRRELAQRPYYKQDVGFDRYKWALKYGVAARKRHGTAIDFDTVEAELSEGWSTFGGPPDLKWIDAREAVRDAWTHSATLQAEHVAAKAGFDHPPTFAESGEGVPRNLDEPNQ